MLRDWVRKYSKLLLTFLVPFSLFHKCGTRKQLAQKALLPIINLHHQKQPEQEQWELFPGMMRKALFGLSLGTVITIG